MAESLGSNPQAVGGGEAIPDIGAVTLGSRVELPFALECARQKVLICVAPGRSSPVGDSGDGKGVGAWLGVSMGAVRAAKEGYLPAVRSTVRHPITDDGRKLKPKNVEGPGGHPILWQRWGHNLDRCTLCLVQVTNLLWQGPSRNRPIHVPIDGKPFLRPGGEAYTFGPKEGPRGCRALVCPTCYVQYGPRIVLAAYPTMSTETVARCSCSWLGFALVTGD